MHVCACARMWVCKFLGTLKAVINQNLSDYCGNIHLCHFDLLTFLLPTLGEEHRIPSIKQLMLLLFMHVGMCVAMSYLNSFGVLRVNPDKHITPLKIKKKTIKY